MVLLIEPNDEGIMLRKYMTWTAFEMTTWGNLSLKHYIV